MMPEEEQDATTEVETNTDEVRKLPFQRRRAMVIAYAQGLGVYFRGIPMDLGTHIVLPKIEAVDLWAQASYNLPQARERTN